MTKQRISILGCGWLGFPLAEKLVSLNYSVKGSTTTQSKVSLLQNIGVEPFVLESRPDFQGNHIEHFFDTDILFLNIPFRRSLEDPRYYKEQIRSILKLVEHSSISFVVFASSTSVYSDHIGLAREDLDLSPYNDRSKVLLEVEQMVLSLSKAQGTVLRFGGLYGENRQIGKFMFRKKDVRRAQGPVNLIHLEDCLNIVLAVIENNVRGEILNAVSDFHPTRRDLYTQAAVKLKLEPPSFAEETESPHKIVLNDKLKKILDYQFCHPDPMDDVLQNV
ncbi:MAG: SDR family NAD(P)-dependent oxidoreductase [Candidatus Omnitrophica bacterium]|nr:SDR family NAD(P)-dependent oxidoreductase [Candidatus Omnitrophota bacterium]